MPGWPPPSACHEGLVVIDGSSAIDPLVAEGPLLAVENLRPAVNLQRVLVLDQPVPMMADLATGDIRPWENGPAVSVPMVSTPFSLTGIDRIQVQVLRDPRPTSVDNTLLSLHLGETTVDIVETIDGQLVIRSGGQNQEAGPIGSSPAVVIDIEPRVDELQIGVGARNAETLHGIHANIAAPNTDTALLTVGGPTTAVTNTHGRRRLIPVHLHVTRQTLPADQVRRAVTGARRVASAVKNKVR